MSDLVAVTTRVGAVCSPRRARVRSCCGVIKPVSEEGLGASRQSDWSCWRANGDGEPLGEGVSAAAESVIVGQVMWIVGRTSRR